MPKKTIKIKCTGTDFLPLDRIKDFQGNLKRRSEYQIRQIITSIEKYGFSFPFFIWKSGKSNWCLDGHGRLSALAIMSEEGYDIPELPVVYVEAKDKKEAKQKLLRMNSNYGDFDPYGIDEFISGIEIDLTEIAIPGFDTNIVTDDAPVIVDAETSYNYQEQFAVMVICDGEKQQREVYEKLIADGYVCKVVAV